MSVSSLPDDDLRVEARRAYEMIREEFSQRD